MNQIPSIISQTIDVLSQKFGATGIALWNILMKQMYIYGWECVIGAILSIIFLIVAIKIYFWAGKEDYDGWKMFSGIITITALLTIIGCIFGAINYFVNPQYQAIQSLIPRSNN